MKSFIKIISFATVIALVLAFVACGGEIPVVTTEAPAVTTEALVETTVAPAVTTEAPVETTETPVETTAAPVLTVDIKTTTGGDLIEFIPSDNRQSIIRLNGKVTYKCATAYVERFISNLELYKNGEDIVTSW